MRINKKPRNIAHVVDIPSIGKGAAIALLEHGCHVTIISSSQDKVTAVLSDNDNPNLQAQVGNVRDEGSYTELLKSLAPVDHVIYSGVDKIIRGAIAEADLEDAKYYFGVKFWGSALTGKSESSSSPNLAVRCCADTASSRLQIRHNQSWRVVDTNLRHWRHEAGRHSVDRWFSERRTLHHDTRSCKRAHREEDPCKLYACSMPHTCRWLM